MPIYICTLFFRDVRNGETTKEFTGDFADEAAAVAARASLVNAFANASGAALFKARLSTDQTYVSTPVASARVTERMATTVFLNQTSGKKASFDVPAPAPALITAGNTLNQGPEWQAVIDEVKSGGSGWFISDGETVDDTGNNGTVGGKLTSNRSGVRTLPTS